MAFYQSNSVDFKVVKDGEDASELAKYTLMMDTEEILMFKKKIENGENTENVLTFSPSATSFRIAETMGSNVKPIAPVIGTQDENLIILYFDVANQMIQYIGLELMNISFIGEDGEVKKVIETDDFSLTLYIENLYYYVSHTEQSKLPLPLRGLLQGFETGNIVFIFQLGFPGYQAERFPFVCRNGVSSDLLNFSVDASSVSAAIQGKKVEFSADGLKIYGTGLEIFDDNDESVFRYDDDLKKLYMKGTIYADDGEFTGTIHARDGDFTGRINAASGIIGGFIIQENQLISTDGKQSIILNGTDGSIKADNIILGTGAKIAQYIQVGEHSFIRSPSQNIPFIESNGIKIYDDGRMLIGDGLSFYGNEYSDGMNTIPGSTIRGLNWAISPETAVFKNIIAQGGLIENVVFKTSTTQAAGGLMIFKPSASIIQVGVDGNAKKIQLEGDLSYFQGGDHVLISAEDGSKIQTKINVIEGDVFTLNDDAPIDGTVFIQLASVINGELTDELLIGVNPNPLTKGEVQYKKDWELFQSGITFTAPTLTKEGNLVYNSNEPPLLFLGNLRSIGKTGYGLYGENVFLKGTLSTQVGTGSERTYAGINTTSGAKSTSYGAGDNSRIVFWAGAAADTTDAIQQSPFQVTEKGNLFAQGGKFKGSVISDSIIQGADIYGLRLHGGSEDVPAELSIYDTSKGIVFRRDFDKITKTGIEVMRLNSNGFTTQSPSRKLGDKTYFVDLRDEQIGFNSDYVNTNELIVGEQGVVKIANGYLSYGEYNNGELSEKFFIRLDYEDSILRGVDFNYKGQSYLKIKEAEKEVVFDGQTRFNNEIAFGKKITYKRKGDYYDLYVD